MKYTKKLFERNITSYEPEKNKWLIILYILLLSLGIILIGMGISFTHIT